MLRQGRRFSPWGRILRLTLAATASKRRERDESRLILQQKFAVQFVVLGQRFPRRLQRA